jgi:hypothetical protein
VSSYEKLRVLHLQVEFPTWRMARPWSYSVGLGLEEGLTASGVQFLTIPSPWLGRAPQIIGSRRFDQVWVEAVHQPHFDQGGWEWLASLAPVRVGLVGESLSYGPEEAELWPDLWPQLSGRHDLVRKRLAHLTHAVMVDESDVEELNSEGAVPAMWWPQAVPARCIQQAPLASPGSRGLFAGTMYGKRQSFFEHPSLQGLVGKLASPEDQGIYPSLFDGIHAALADFMNQNRPEWRRSFPEYIDIWRRVRRQLFSLFLEGLQNGSAVVNLPHLAKTYAGRVVEGMAAGRPVISWEVPNRPRNRALFENGAEILLFNHNDPEQLAEHIRHIQREPAFGERVAENARQKISRLHTLEHRVAQILDWTTTGREPTFV